MKKSIWVLGILTLVFVLAFTGCPEPSGPDGPINTNTPSNSGSLPDSESLNVVYSATTRYHTVPYDGANARSAAGLDNLLYTAQDNSHYYYVFLLGHIDLVPVAYREPVIYNGVTNAIVKYEKSNATQDSFSQSVSNAYQHSVSNKTTTNFGIVAKAGVDLGPFSASVKTSYSNQVIDEESSTRSFESTWGTASSKISSYTDTLEMIIGNNNEPAGKYRYSLFCTTDVYFVVKTNKAKTQVVDSYTSFCARADSFAWGIDYEPDLGGNFGRTAEGNLLQIPQLTLSSLPDPVETIDYFPDDPNKVAAPYAGTPAGAYPVTQKITLSTPTEGAVIHYTTDGSAPTTSSEYYIPNVTEIIVSVDTTIKAIAVKPGMTNSNVFTAEYVILPYVTEYTRTIRPGIGLSGSSNQTGSVKIWDPNFDHFTYDFNIERLKSEGYKSFDIFVSFRIYIKYGTLIYGIIPGHVTTGHVISNNGAWGTKKEEGVYGGWSISLSPVRIFSWISRSYTLNVPIDKFNNQFTFGSDVNDEGGSSNAAYIGETTIRVTAKK